MWIFRYFSLCFWHAFSILIDQAPNAPKNIQSYISNVKLMNGMSSFEPQIFRSSVFYICILHLLDCNRKRKRIKKIFKPLWSMLNLRTELGYHVKKLWKSQKHINIQVNNSRKSRKNVCHYTLTLHCHSGKFSIRE